MDRKLFKSTFQIENLPEWVCPTCSKGVLTLKREDFHPKELSHSRDHSHDAWEPEWISYTFAATFICSNPDCLETVSSVGNGFVDWDVEEIDDFPQQVYADYFKPRFFHPHLKAFSLSENVPPEVSDFFNRSFELIFADPSSALNQVRKGVEAMLTGFGVKRFDRVNGKLKPVNLHQRITLLPAKHSDLKEIMLAVKWLGNAGSHSGSDVTIDDVLDAYELSSHILQEVYDEKSKAIKSLAKGVNKQKGPKKKK